MKLPDILNRNLLIIFSITLIAVMGVSSITPAFPAVKQALGLSNQQVGLLITFFSGPGIILTPAFGILSDRVGRKVILVPSLVLYAISGTACFFINDFQWLLFMRIFQGIGASALGALNITLIGDIFQGQQRIKAMGWNASVLSITTASYPAIGGALTLLGWQFPFLLSLLALPVALLVFFGLRNPEPQPTDHFFSYLRASKRILFRKNVLIIFLATFVVFIALFGGFLTYFPLLMHEFYSADSWQTGLLMAGMSLVTAIISSRLSWFQRKFSESSLIHFGFFAYSAGFMLMPLMPKMIWMLVPVIIFGLGHGVIFPSLQTKLTNLSETRYRGMLMSINGMVLRGGQALGPVILGWFYLLGGMVAAFLLTAVLTFIMFFVAILTMPPKEN
jgi:MFS family permease